MRIYVVTSRCGCLLDPPSCYKSKADAEKAVRKMVLVVLRDMIDEAIANDGIEDEVDFNIDKDDDKLLTFAVKHEYAASYNCKDSQGNAIVDTITIGDEWTEFRIDACNVKEESKAKPKKKKAPAKHHEG